eukprot:212107-Pyramimonas_sp.AAC.2
METTFWQPLRNFSPRILLVSVWSETIKVSCVSCKHLLGKVRVPCTNGRDHDYNVQSGLPRDVRTQLSTWKLSGVFQGGPL